MTAARGRLANSGRVVEVEIAGTTIRSVREATGPAASCLAPALWDIQVNGRWGVSFSDEALTVEQVSAISRAQAAMGTARYCPTLISALEAQTTHALRTIARACESDALVGRMVLGVHLEGPYLSERDGYRGAHDRGAIRDPNWGEFRRWQDAAGGRIRLVTLAPERPGAIGFIEALTRSGVVAAIGHSSADGATIRAAVDAGARLSTHLGNGLASPIERHPNPIFDQAAEDRLAASIIADGHHLDAATLRVLARAKGAARLILVSDASPLAGMPPGRYGAWEVAGSGRIVVAGTNYLAGSGASLADCVGFARSTTGWNLAESIAAATATPARLLGVATPEIADGRPANVVEYREEGGRFEVVRTCVDGKWFSPDPASRRDRAGPASPGPCGPS